MQYCTRMQMLERFDARSVGQLVNDLGVEVDPNTLLMDPVLLNHLQSASGKIEAALLQGNRYSTSDLATIAKVDPLINPWTPWPITPRG